MKELQQVYANLCAELGDIAFKKTILELEAKQVEENLKKVAVSIAEAQKKLEVQAATDEVMETHAPVFEKLAVAEASEAKEASNEQQAEIQ